MNAMTREKPTDPGLPPAIAEALASLAAEHRSMRVIEQLYADAPDHDHAPPADADAADAAMGERLAARTRFRAQNAQRAFALALDSGGGPIVADDVAADVVADGVVATVADDVDTAKVLAMEQARLDQEDTSRPG
jgi:hypothetical protein